MQSTCVQHQAVGVRCSFALYALDLCWAIVRSKWLLHLDVLSRYSAEDCTSLLFKLEGEGTNHPLKQTRYACIQWFSQLASRNRVSLHDLVTRL